MKLNIALFVLGLLLIIGGVVVHFLKIDFSANALIISGMMVEFLAIYLIFKTFSNIKKDD
ncbi:hypothetical protein [Frigoriflavimonas asaccharolytica]|uniref:Putative membrane-anchored protein n=1 Tax=Frigoriflavimonas asaccharolytica TaxID=2735899 RepID=A0A8J8G524_9FLAO|nr:hypothetical protein [Frigoriflavimonas asaccharolytica]NRS91404.1 putative membrane-anchored protein [Frigoriflavimonas asaccharolytica]